MPVSKKPICSDQVLQTLQWMRRNEFRPVALRPREKAAVDGKYADLDYKPPDDNYWKTSDYGVGVVTGPRHSGPIDVDLDCEESVFFAKSFLPKTTAIFGRKTKRDSHYLYRVSSPDMAKRAYVDPVSGSTIVELRGDGGHQTVMPGSIHQGTGELVEWSTIPFPEVPVVEEKLLVLSVQKVAIATMIVRHMWLEGQRNLVNLYLAGMFHRLEWTEDDVRSLIEAVMDYVNLENENRKKTLDSISLTYRKAERSQKVAGAGKLRELIKNDKAVDCIMSWAGSPTASFISEYNDAYAVALYGSRFRVAMTDVDPGGQITFMSRDDFLFWTASDCVDVVNKKGEINRVPKGKIWLASPRHRSYRSVEFLPGLEDPPPSTLNLWTGWHVQPAEGCCQAWLRLLRDVICGKDDKLFSWMLHWFANIVREPMEKSLTAPVIIGNQGAGKSLLLTYFGEILGSAYVVATNPEHIQGKHNKHLAGALLLHSEEALHSGDKRHRSIIKSLITDRSRISEPKNVDAVSVRNWMRLVLTSNDSNAAAAEAGDRRYTCIDMGDRKLPDALRDEVLEEMKSGGPAALFHFLLDMSYDPALPRTNIKNASLERLKSSNYSPVEAWWYDTLSSAYLLPELLSWASKPAHDDWPEIVSSAALYVSMVLRSRDQGYRSLPSSVIFMNDLKKMTGKKFAPMQRSYVNPYDMEMSTPQMIRSLSSRQNSITDMPGCASCRKAFEKYVGQKVEWPADLPEEDKSAADKEREEKRKDGERF